MFECTAGTRTRTSTHIRIRLPLAYEIGQPQKRKRRRKCNYTVGGEGGGEGGRQMGTEFKAIRIRRSKVTCICMYSYMPHMPLNVAILMWQYFDKCFAKAATQNPIHFCRLHH